MIKRRGRQNKARTSKTVIYFDITAITANQLLLVLYTSLRHLIFLNVALANTDLVTTSKCKRMPDLNSKLALKAGQL